MKFEWSKSNETSHAEIDNEHMTLVSLIDNLRSATEDGGVGKIDKSNCIIDKLRDYTHYHFTNEERVMDSFDYDFSKKHKNEHALFIIKIADLRFHADSIEEEAPKLVTFLYNWLINHISRTDQDLVAKLHGQTGLVTPLHGDQTQLVINSAYAVAALLDRQVGFLKNPNGGPWKKRYLEDIANTSDRLLNLVFLAESRIEKEKESSLHRASMEGIRAATINAASKIADVQAMKVIEYAKRITENVGVTLGCGTTMKRKIHYLDNIIDLIKNNYVFSDDQVKLIISAYHSANTVIEKDMTLCPVPNFAESTEQYSPFKAIFPPIEITERAASQQAVLKGLEESTETPP